MRTFDDEQGRPWQAALLEGAYGHVMMVFAPLDGTGIRQLLLGADSRLAAEAELLVLSDENLRARLAESRPWGALPGEP